MLIGAIGHCPFMYGIVTGPRPNEREGAEGDGGSPTAKGPSLLLLLIDHLAPMTRWGVGNGCNTRGVEVITWAVAMDGYGGLGGGGRDRLGNPFPSTDAHTRAHACTMDCILPDTRTNMLFTYARTVMYRMPCEAVMH